MSHLGLVRSCSQKKLTTLKILVKNNYIILEVSRKNMMRHKEVSGN